MREGRTSSNVSSVTGFIKNISKSLMAVLFNKLSRLKVVCTFSSADLII